MRWTVLSTKWPEVVRWIQRGRGYETIMNTSNPSSNNVKSLEFQSRLELLENVSKEVIDIKDWQNAIREKEKLVPYKTLWLSDNELLKFFREESAKLERDRLSRGIGRGLW